MYPLHGTTPVKKRYTILLGTRYLLARNRDTATWYNVPARWNKEYPLHGIGVPATWNSEYPLLGTEYPLHGTRVPASWYNEYQLQGTMLLLLETKVALISEMIRHRKDAARIIEVKSWKYFNVKLAMATSNIIQKC